MAEPRAPWIDILVIVLAMTAPRKEKGKEILGKKAHVRLSLRR